MACSFSADTRASLSWPRLLTPIPDVRSIYFSRRYPREWLPSAGRAQPESGHMYALNKVVLRLRFLICHIFSLLMRTSFHAVLAEQLNQNRVGTRPSCMLASALACRLHTAVHFRNHAAEMMPDLTRKPEPPIPSFWNQSAVVPGTFISPRTSVRGISFFAFKATASFSASPYLR